MNLAMWRPTAFPAVMVDGRSQILKFAAGRSRASMRCGAARSAPRSLWPPLRITVRERPASLTLGNRVEPVLVALAGAGGDPFRGIRHG